MKHLLIRWLVLALGVILATRLVPGISYSDGPTLIVVVLVLSLFNAILKPLLLLFTLPFILLTMGLGIILINALLFYWAGSGLIAGFVVNSFWSAIGGAIVVSVTNLVISILTRGPPRPPKAPTPGDVIDI